MVHRIERKKKKTRKKNNTEKKKDCEHPKITNELNDQIICLNVVIFRFLSHCAAVAAAHNVSSSVDT